MCNGLMPRLSRFFDVPNCRTKWGAKVTLSFAVCGACRVAMPIPKSSEYIRDLPSDETHRVIALLNDRGFLGDF